MARPLLVLALLALAHPPQDEATIEIRAIRTAFEDNRAAISASGSIRFHSCDGVLAHAPDIESVSKLLAGDWQRRSPSRGTYLFDGTSRLYEDLYTTEELVARRKMLSPTTWSSNIKALRLLADGETTLVDRIGVHADGKTVLHTPGLKAGVREFFRLAENRPLDLGDPDPPDYDMRRLLDGVIAGSSKMVVTEIDNDARLEGAEVVKLRVEDPSGDLRVTYWVDLQHGAIPIRYRVLRWIPHASATVLLVFHNDDVRWVGRGWLPFRSSTAQGTVNKGGDLAPMFVREVVVEEADFSKRPSPESFALEFSQETGLADSDRRLGFGVRRVWTLKDFSPAARARARPIGQGGPSRSP
jgi:hypothetical protein